MDENVRTPYDFIEITIDSVIVSARPIKWDKEMVDGVGHAADGSMVVPVGFEGTCPHCGDMVLFDVDFKEIKCPNCGRGEDVKFEAASPFQDPGQYGEPIPDGKTEEKPFEPPVPDAGVAEAISQDVVEEWLDTDPADEYHEHINAEAEKDESDN